MNKFLYTFTKMQCDKKTEEQITEEQTVEEQTVEEQVIEEQVIEEQTVEEQVIEEQTVEEQVTEEQTVEEQVIEEQVIKYKNFVDFVKYNDKDALDNEKFVIKNENLYLNSNKNTIDYGLIVEKSKEHTTIVCQSQIKIEEINDINLFANNHKQIYKNNEYERVEYCEDGTIIRMYYYKNKWYTSTTRCIDARDAKWSSTKTFDQMFYESYDKQIQFENLKKNETYFFILKHPENRLVVKHKKPEIVYIYSINNESNIVDFSKPETLEYMSSPQIIGYLDISYIESVKCNDKRGIMIYERNDDKSNFKIYKYDFEEYKYVHHIRGNVPNIFYRYIELLNDQDKLNALIYYYNEYNFAYLQNEIVKFANFIFKLYVNSHILKKINIEKTNKYNNILKMIHYKYLNRAEKKPIGFVDVLNSVYSLYPHVLAKFLDIKKNLFKN